MDNPGRPYAGAGGVLIEDSEIARNGKPIGGAQDLIIKIQNSTIVDNESAVVYSWASFVWLDNCTIARNDGYVLSLDGTGTVENCWIEGNTEGIYVEREQATIVDNVIINNGGVVRFDLEGGTLRGNTIVGNNTGANALILSNQGGQVVANNIIAFNTSERLFDSISGSITVTANDIVGNTIGEFGPYIDGGDNFSLDPRFCDRAGKIFTLESTSPCLAANSPNGTRVGALGEGCKTIVGATLELSPGTMAMNANGLITATITGVEGLDVSTVRLNESVAPVERPGNGKGQRLQFRVSDLVPTLVVRGADRLASVALTGRLVTGEEVRASATIRIAPGKGQGDGPLLAGDASTPAAPGIASVTPNPFNPTTRIRIALAQSGPVNLSIYNVGGRLVETLVQERLPAGTHDLTWSASDLPSGVYFARLVTGDGTFTRKLVIAR